MAYYNNYFPATYQPLNPAYTPVNPAVYPTMQQPSVTAGAGAAPMMTPPTIRAEIVQVEDEKAAQNYPVGVGASQMMIAKDDSAIYVKTSLQNGQSTFDVFVKRPPAQVDDRAGTKFVTWEQLEARLAEFASAPAKKEKKGKDDE